MNSDYLTFSTCHQKINVGSLIGNRYLIQSILGKEEFSCTYFAVDKCRFYEPCIVKLFDFTWMEIPKNFQEKLRKLFSQEIEALYHCDCHQIPKFLAYFSLNNQFYLVQEYIKGKSYYQLSQKLREHGQSFTEDEIVSLLINLLLVIEYIHDRGIIHRQISPYNIIQGYFILINLHQEINFLA